MKSDIFYSNNMPVNEAKVIAHDMKCLYKDPVLGFHSFPSWFLHFLCNPGQNVVAQALHM